MSPRDFRLFAESYVERVLTRAGYEVHPTEPCDQKVDLVLSKDDLHASKVRIKATRCKNGIPNYVFIEKSKITLSPNVLIALLIADGDQLSLFLIPSTVWLTPGDLFIGMDYQGLQSKPEWGIRFAKDRLGRLYDNYLVPTPHSESP